MKLFFLFILLVDLAMCKSSTDRSKVVNIEKRRGLGIEKVAKFIHVELEVYPYSKDSVLVKTFITNKDSSDFAAYKPLLPFDNFNENIFGIMEDSSYKGVEFNGISKEKFLKYEDGKSSGYIIPKLDSDQFVNLESNKTLIFESNVACKYDFKKYLNEGLNNFKIIYWVDFPYMKDGRQVLELDSVDKKLKPVYYVVTLDEKDDPDSMRIPFSIPLSSR
jgi:hypothetical protein